MLIAPTKTSIDIGTVAMTMPTFTRTNGSYESTYAAMLAAGFASAYYDVHDYEPAVTWPSGIQAETMDTDGDPNCLDYIWVKGEIEVLSAQVACNEHAPGDSTLYPSDHFALLAEVEV